MPILHEYTTVDKSDWMRGEWDSEPDKVQGIDDATGLDTLIVRGPSGALCGYIGVPEDHPYFGVEYGGCTQSPKCEESWCDHRPESRIEVHGGLTFSGFCHDATRENWEQWRTNMQGRRDEAVKYPRGDSARAFQTKGHLMDDYEAWAQHQTATAICHLPSEGRPDRVWWLGFDCAHSGDVSPSYDRGDGYNTYKDRHYVAREIASLAKQLAAISPDRESA